MAFAKPRLSTSKWFRPKIERKLLSKILPIRMEARSVSARHHFSQGRIRSCSRAIARSEEHTSELQSLMRISYAVFCLKKKKNKKTEKCVNNMMHTQN